MKALRLVLFVTAMLASAIAWSDEAAKAEADRLLEAMNMANVMDQAIETSLDAQISQNPSLAPYKGVMQAFLRKHMSFKSLKTEFVDLYANEFTAAELKEMRTFYETPTGKKAIGKMPALFNKGEQIGLKRVQDNIPELQQMIKEESAKIEKKEKASQKKKQNE